MHINLYDIYCLRVRIYSFWVVFIELEKETKQKYNLKMEVELKSWIKDVFFVLYLKWKTKWKTLVLASSVLFCKDVCSMYWKEALEEKTHWKLPFKDCEIFKRVLRHKKYWKSKRFHIIRLNTIKNLLKSFWKLLKTLKVLEILLNYKKTTKSMSPYT